MGIAILPKQERVATQANSEAREAKGDEWRPAPSPESLGVGAGRGGGRPTAAIAACRVFIMERMLSPSQSSFDSDYDDAREINPGTWAAAGRADIMNGLGVKIRKRYICIAKWEPPTMRVLGVEWQ